MICYFIIFCLKCQIESQQEWKTNEVLQQSILQQSILQQSISVLEVSLKAKAELHVAILVRDDNLTFLFTILTTYGSFKA